MRRATVLAAQLATRAGAAATAGTASLEATATATATAASISLSQSRSFAADAHHAERPIKPNPLQQIVPPILSGFDATVDATKRLTTGLVNGLATNRVTRGSVAYFANNMLLSGTFIDVTDLDLPKWAAWLASSGYTDRAGWAKIVEGLKQQQADMGPKEIETVVAALDEMDLYDKTLYQGFAETIKEKFTEFDTPGLAKLIHAYARNDHFDEELYDDIADSITYCNHYLAPITISPVDIANVFSAYAKYDVNRGDLFVLLARCVWERRLREISDEDFSKAVAGLLSSFNKLAFWPDCTEAILVVARDRPGALSASDQALVTQTLDKLKELNGGKLPYFEEGYKDPEHYHGPGFGDYNLWVARDELISEYYKPTDVKVLKEGFRGMVTLPQGATATATATATS